MSRLMTCISQWSKFGGLQAHIDLTALTTVLQNHLSQSARTSFQEAQEILPKLGAPELRVKDGVLRDFRSKMHFLLACFLEVEPLSDNTTSHSLA
ncbi:Exocyst complex component 2 [Halocaridina rubra]|uniref:Exocyst complex component 2 n=1 Tax=Halocaridina rubra TaxID=373956 RepID=A0AAN9A9Q9_HALRR